MSFQTRMPVGITAIGIMFLSACGGGGVDDSGPPEIRIFDPAVTELTKITLLPTATSPRFQVETIDRSDVVFDRNNFLDDFQDFVRVVRQH